MKKKLLIVLSLVVVIISTTFVHATDLSSRYSTGNALIPYYYSHEIDSNHEVMYFNISNITDKPVDVFLTLYKQDGTIITDDSIIMPVLTESQVTNYSDQISDNTVKFTLDSHASVLLHIKNTNSTYGYGKIQWSQEGSAEKALVVFGSAICSIDNNRSRFAVPVNGGLPF